MNKTLKNISIGLISILLSFFIYRFITINLLDFIPFVVTNKLPLYICIILIQSVIIFIIIKGFTENQLDPISKKMLWFQYLIIMIFILFGRNIGVKGIELNIFNSFKNWFSDSYSLIVNAANLLMYIPVAINFIDKDNKKSIVQLTIFITICEIIQCTCSLGIFDIGDILLNILGFIIGLQIFKKKYLYNFIKTFKLF